MTSVESTPLTAVKSIIVTGGTSGIGLAIVKAFAAQSHEIAVLDVNASAGPSIVSQIATEFPKAKLTFWKCNVASWEDQAAVFKQVFNQHGNRLDIVMANAGISEQGRSGLTVIDEDEPAEPQLGVVNVNFTGVLYSVKLAAHYMNKKPMNSSSSRGLIICTASNAGIYPFPVAPVYAATKAGVIGLVRSLAKPYELAQIQINALAPAVLETNIAPNKALFNHMILTPFETLTKGVAHFIENPSLSGAIAEIHGSMVTIREPPPFVDEDSAKNLENFWKLGYA